MKICLFSKNYGALDGCAQSVFDVIVSLLESVVDLHVIYNKQFPNISQHDGFDIKGRLKTHQIPRNNIIDSILNTNSFNLGSNAQVIIQTYFNLVEVLKYRVPKIILIDVKNHTFSYASHHRIQIPLN